VGAADAGRLGRVPSAGAADRLGRPVARLLPRRPHALGDPVEDRGTARLGPPRRRSRLQGADAPRPVAGGSARRHIPPGLRRAPLQLAVPDRRRVGGGDRQPDDARGHAHRLGPGPGVRLPWPDGHLREAKRTARDRLHGRDQAVPAPDRVPADDATDRAGVELHPLLHQITLGAYTRVADLDATAILPPRPPKACVSPPPPPRDAAPRTPPPFRPPCRTR
jgi:hypothetical protein